MTGRDQPARAEALIRLDDRVLGYPKGPRGRADRWQTVALCDMTLRDPPLDAGDDHFYACAVGGLPIVQHLGFDPIWFGVLFAMTIQMGYISPPFGYTLFYIKATLPPQIGMGTVYRGILPFFLLQLVGLLLCALFPGAMTWLPGLMN